MKRSSKAKKAKAGSGVAFPSRRHDWGGDGTLVCPNSVRVNLPFTQVLAPGTTSGGLYVYQYRANSCFDPDYSGTGLQPNGFDQWAQFYNSFVVLSSEVIVEYVASGAYVGELVVVPSFNASSPANTKEATGWRYAKSVMGVPSGNATYHKIVSKMSTATMCGVPPAAVLSDSDWASTISTNPANFNTWFWNIFLQNQSSSTTLGDYLRVTIVYDVKFFDPAQSAFSATHRLSPFLAAESTACSAEAASACTVTQTGKPCCCSHPK